MSVRAQGRVITAMLTILAGSGVFILARTLYLSVS